jgi:allantoate deiminase
LGVALVESLSAPLHFEIEVIGFSEEEGVRFGVPFLGSRALIGDSDFSAPIHDAIRAFGLDPSRIGEAATEAAGYLEFHIEQGPVLEELGQPLGIVEAIAGQSRLEVAFEGKANHAGTTPMTLRRDALACASEWIGTVEHEARNTFGIVATVGKLEVSPGAGNVIPGVVRASLDVRHARDLIRRNALERILHHASEISHARGIHVSWTQLLDQAAVPMDRALMKTLEQSVAEAGYPVHYMTSGAGHDAMIVAKKMPAAMLFLRSPGGISHHPDEAVLEEDVAAAMETGMRFLVNIEKQHAESRPHA